MCASHHATSRDSLEMQTTLSLNKSDGWKATIKTAKARKCKTNKTRPLSWALSGVRKQRGHHQWPLRKTIPDRSAVLVWVRTGSGLGKIGNALEIGQHLHLQSPSHLALWWSGTRGASSLVDNPAAFPISLQQQKLRYHKKPLFTQRAPPQKERAGVSPSKYAPFSPIHFFVHV